MSEFTIGGFAESLIANELEKINDDPSYIAEAVSSQPPQADVPDLRKVEIPNNFMNEVLGKSTQEEVEDQAIVEKPSEDLFGKLQSLVRELDSVLTEMTMSGHIGVNMAGKGPKPKAMKRGEDGYLTPTQGVASAMKFLKKLNKRTGLSRSVDDGRDLGENDPGVHDDPAGPPRLVRKLQRRKP